MSDPEKMLILELIGVAEKDAKRNFQGTNVYDKNKTQAGAKRFIASEKFRELCEFVGGDAGVIRKRVRSSI